MDTYYSKNKTYLLDYQKNYYQKNKEERVKKQKEKYHAIYKHDVKMVNRSKKNFENWYKKQKKLKKYCFICNKIIMEKNFFKNHILTRRHAVNTQILNLLIFTKDSYKTQKVVKKRRVRNQIKKKNFFVYQKEPIIIDFDN